MSMPNLSPFQQFTKLASPQYLTLITIYCLIFTGNLFAFIEDVSFMGVDEGSLTTAINEMFIEPYYDMTASYHTKYYGWTYVSLNFFLLSPIVGILTLFNANDPAIINFCIRLILFFISLATVLFFYHLLLSITKRKWLSFLATVYFMLNPATAHYWFTIHPESLGMLLSLVGVMFFLKFLADREIRNYFLCVIMLVLSSLSKHPFFIISLPILLYILGDYCDWKSHKLIRFIQSQDFWLTLSATITIATALFFFIHPYAFINFSDFILYQTALSNSTTSKSSLSGGLFTWWNLIKESPLIIIHSVVTLGALTLVATGKRTPLLFVFSTAVSSCIMFVFILMQNQFYSLTYIAPLYPIFILNTCVAACYIYSLISHTAIKIITVVTTGLVFSYLLLSASTPTIEEVVSRTLLHDQTTKKLSWDYISSLPVGSKIIWSPGVAMPPAHRKHSCHIWQGCGDTAGITAFNPDYFIINKEYRYMDKQVINGYIKEHDFCTIRNLEASPPTSKFSSGQSSASVTSLQRINNTFDNWERNLIIGPTITIYSRCIEP